MDALRLVNETIEALTAVDVARLRTLAETAPISCRPATAGERAELAARRAALAQLLVYTRRNLRLMGSRSLTWQGAGDVYGTFRD